MGNIINIDGLQKFFENCKSLFVWEKGSGSNSVKLGPSSQENESNGGYCIAEGYASKAIGGTCHAEGSGTTASGAASHSEGELTVASGGSSHAEGQETKAIGDYSHAEGLKTIAEGNYSHAEGSLTFAYGEASHAEGSGTGEEPYIEISIKSTSTEGVYDVTGIDAGTVILFKPLIYKTELRLIMATSSPSGPAQIVLNSAFTETISSYQSARLVNHGAIGTGSHSEGLTTLAYGVGSHSEGRETRAFGDGSFAGGYGSYAFGTGSFACGNHVVAGANEGGGQCAFGKYNSYVGTAYSSGIMSIGWGTSANPLTAAYLEKDGVFHTQSDERLKADIKNIPDNVLSAIDSVRLRQFTYKTEKEEKAIKPVTNFGAIAQEVISALTDNGINYTNTSLVDGNEESRYSIDYNGLLVAKCALYENKISEMESSLNECMEKIKEIYK